jgi:hypothetical protein
MAKNPNIYRVHEAASEIAMQNALLRELAARAAEVLKLPRPDTFLGRKTYEPFPRERKKPD